MERDRTTRQDERQYFIDRQTYLDNLGQAQRDFDIQQLLNNQQLTQEQRDYALDQYEQAKQISTGERAYSQQMLEELQALATQERAYDVQRQTRLDTLARDERQHMEQERTRIQGISDSMAQELDQLRQTYGNLPQTRAFTQADVDAEAARRHTAYEANIDKAADRVASITEAELITNGIDTSYTCWYSSSRDYQPDCQRIQQRLQPCLR